MKSIFRNPGLYIAFLFGVLLWVMFSALGEPGTASEELFIPVLAISGFIPAVIWPKHFYLYPLAHLIGQLAIGVILSGWWAFGMILFLLGFSLISGVGSIAGKVTRLVIDTLRGVVAEDH